MNPWALRLMLLVAVLLSGCAGFQKVEPGNVAVKGKMTVVPQGPWNRWDGPGMGSAEIWTQEGFALDSLVFYVGIKDGEPLAPGDGQRQKEIPKFRANMEPHQIVEIYEAMATRDGSAFRMERLAPDPFLGAPGFRFDFSVTRKADELTQKGVGFGAVRSGELYLMVYRAPKLYYFPKYLPAVEAIARSARPGG